ncbi:MAG: YicC family protein [Deltaproteobacteria bacterium]|nr:MAG: YicC family protein [Deltaproteobacteria bacterium]
MKSMTGYGRAQANTPLGIITAEITSVNHRNLDIRLRLPDLCRFLEIELRVACKDTLRRGHVEGNIKIERDEGAIARDISLNLTVARAYYEEVRKFQESVGLDREPDPSWIFQNPEVWQTPEAPGNDDIRAAILPVFREALRNLVMAREAEGRKLTAFFEEKLKEIDPILKEIDSFMPDLPRLVRESLIKRLEELKMDPALNPDRLAQEAAYLAQRADITEEVSRLASHLKAFREKILGEKVSGRELDFTIQEMNREVNTMGSKSVSYDLSSHVIRLKEILNQLREQVQNVE